MAMKPRPLRAARKSNISTQRTSKLFIDSLDAQDFRLLFEQALNSSKALLHTQQHVHERTLNERQRERQLDTIVQYGFRLAQQPACLATSREQEIASMLNALHQEGSWQAYVPSRLRHEPKVDLAATAVITAYKYKLVRKPGMAEKAYRQYGIALATIRESIDTTDSSLMAVALLSLFEFLVEINSASQRKHREGIGQILRARKRTRVTPTEFEGAILFGDWSLRYRGPIARGMASPFEDQYWLDMEPTRSLGTPPGLIRLQKVTNQLLIRIPRLVFCTRALRGLSTGFDAEQVLENTIKLASELLNSDDDAAESEILHRVSVVETADALDRAVAPYSLEYATFKEMECCLTFWRMRIDVLRICLILCNLPQTADLAAATFRLDEVAIKAKLEGLISNIIMSRQYAVKNTLYGPLRLVEALFSAWAAASSLQSWRRTDMSFLRYWILKRFNDASFQPRKATVGFLDDETSVTVGGPLKGYWVKSLGGRQQDGTSVCSKLPYS